MTAVGQAPAASLSAMPTTFTSSIDRVIGPTPPGFGVNADARVRASRSMSPTIFYFPVSGSSARETPTSMSTTPSFTMSAVTIPAWPAAATTTSA